VKISKYAILFLGNMWLPHSREMKLAASYSSESMGLTYQTTPQFIIPVPKTRVYMQNGKKKDVRALTV